MNKPYIPCVTIFNMIIAIVFLCLKIKDVSIIFALLAIASAILEQNTKVRSV